MQFQAAELSDCDDFGEEKAPSCTHKAFKGTVHPKIQNTHFPLTCNAIYQSK